MRRALLIVAIVLAGCGSTVAVPDRAPPEPAAKEAPPKGLDPKPDLPLQWTPGTPDWAQ